jgi:hypothetical protein
MVLTPVYLPRMKSKPKPWRTNRSPTLAVGLRSSSADYALIKSIQEIAQFMAKKTIAEHSENELTWDILRGIGIDFGVTSVKQAIALEDLTET